MHMQKKCKTKLTKAVIHWTPHGNCGRRKPKAMCTAMDRINLKEQIQMIAKYKNVKECQRMSNL
jgi:hypothetical protein